MHTRIQDRLPSRYRNNLPCKIVYTVKNMRPRFLRTRLTISLFCVTAFAQNDHVAVEVGWLPISDAEKAQKEPLVEKSVGVEAIFLGANTCGMSAPGRIGSANASSMSG